MEKLVIWLLILLAVMFSARPQGAALRAPTAMNRQKFKFILNGKSVRAEAGSGFYTKIDLGKAKYHFEIGAGKENFKWE